MSSTLLFMLASITVAATALLLGHGLVRIADSLHEIAVAMREAQELRARVSLQHSLRPLERAEYDWWVHAIKDFIHWYRAGMPGLP